MLIRAGAVAWFRWSLLTVALLLPLLISLSLPEQAARSAAPWVSELHRFVQVRLRQPVLAGGAGILTAWVGYWFLLRWGWGAGGTADAVTKIQRRRFIWSVQPVIVALAAGALLLVDHRQLYWSGAILIVVWALSRLLATAAQWQARTTDPAQAAVHGLGLCFPLVVVGTTAAWYGLRHVLSPRPSDGETGFYLVMEGVFWLSLAAALVALAGCWVGQLLGSPRRRDSAVN